MKVTCKRIFFCILRWTVRIAETGTESQYIFRIHLVPSLKMSSQSKFFLILIFKQIE